MDIFFASAHLAGNSQLIANGDEAILFDCSTAFCAAETVENIERILAKKKLVAIILSHSHYDHVTGLPVIKGAFPDVPVYAHPYALEVFKNSHALATMQSMCDNAESLYGNGFACPEFESNRLMAEQPLSDGQLFSLGGKQVKVIFTPGHTRDSVSLDFPESGFCLLSETLGVLRFDGRVQPCFLSGYQAALDSLKKIRNLGKRKTVLSHSEKMQAESESLNFLIKSEASIKSSCELICRLFDEGKGSGDIFKGYEREFWSESYRDVWPYEAFSLNAAAAIKTALREKRNQA